MQIRTGMMRFVCQKAALILLMAFVAGCSGVFDGASVSADEISINASGTSFVVDFPKAVVEGTVTAETLYMVEISSAESNLAEYDSGTGVEASTSETRVEAEIEIQSATRVVFSPTESLTSGSEYALVVTDQIGFTDGTYFEGTRYTFVTVGGAADVEAPTVIITSPADEATDVAANAVVDATFSESMDSTSITAETFVITGSDPVEGEVTYIDATNTARFTPSSNFELSHTYTATVYTGVADPAGNSMSEANTWTFTTVAEAAALMAPALSSVTTALQKYNSYGMVPDLSWTYAMLPACTYSDSSSLDIYVTYSVSGLPSWLSFDASARTLTLSGGGNVPAGANTAAEVTYICTDLSNSSNTDSITFTVNDADGGGVIDLKEYQYGEVPLVDNRTGWVWLTPGDVDLYRPRVDSYYKVPTNIVVTSSGMDPTDSSDDSADFDGDGVSNAAEILAGTNLFIAASNGTFPGPHSNLTSGEIKEGITVGDMDNDGNLDIVASEYGGEDVAIFFGDGAGSFGDPVQYSVAGSGGYDVTVGDLDGDGDLDLVGTSYTEKEIYTQLNNLGEDFGDPTVYSLGANTPQDVVAADLSGDGNLDLAVIGGVKFGGGTIDVFLGTGSGTFVAGDSCAMTGYSYDIVAADLDGDGDLDLATIDGSNDRLVVFMGYGNGTFADGVNYTTADGSDGITAGDLDGDGDLDLVSANYSDNNVSVFMNDGDGTFASKEDYDAGAGPYGIVAADLDGDGDLDLAVASWDDNTMAILKNNGDGTFASAVLYTAVDPGSYATDIVAADFDGDGDLDLAVSDWSGAVGVILNQ
jgi:hypothetical protein